jgi:hypothetical protein
MYKNSYVLQLVLRELTVKDKGFLSVSVVCLVLRFVVRVTCPNKVNKQPVILLVRVSFVRGQHCLLQSV